MNGTRRGPVSGARRRARGSRRRAIATAVVTVAAAAAVLAACQSLPPAQMRTDGPPWDAPQPPASYLEAADFEPRPLGFEGDESQVPYFVKLIVTVDGELVELPPGIGLDPDSGVQAPIHGHLDDGVLNVERAESDPPPRVDQIFALWGVRYTKECIGGACGKVSVLVNGEPADWDVELDTDSVVEVQVTSVGG